MKLIGNLKKEVENAADMVEAKELIRKAGMELTDDEMEQVTGGGSSSHPLSGLGMENIRRE